MKNEFLETIKIDGGKVYHLEYHQKRYEGVLKSFGLNSFKNLADFIKAPKKSLYRCRLVYTPQDTEKIGVEYIEYKKRDIKTLKLVYDDNIEYSKKSTNRDAIDRLFNKRNGADDILIVKNGLITDTSIANIAFYDEVWKTPRNPLLKGTTRQRYIDSGKLIEEDIHVEDIKNYSKVALLNAMIDFDIISDNNLKDIFC